VYCLTHKTHETKCPKNINDYTVCGFGTTSRTRHFIARENIALEKEMAV